MVFDELTVIKILNILKEDNNRSKKIDKCLKQIAIDKKNKQIFKYLFSGIVEINSILQKWFLMKS